MPRFFYIASTQGGEIKKGLVEAPDRLTLQSKLQKSNLIVISIEKKKQSRILTDLRQSTGKFGKISQVDKILFARYLGTLIRGGVSLGEGLVILKKGTTSPKMKSVLDGLIKATNAGRSLHSGLAEYPKIFSHFFCNIVKTGEEGGTLDDNLNQLADELTKSFELKRKIRGVMIYPIIIIIVALSVGLMMSIFILPKLTSLFDSFQVALPLSTRIFLAVATILEKYGVYVFGGIFILIMALISLAKTKVGRPIVHRVLLVLPIFGKIIRNINIANFCRTLGTLLHSGLHILEALTITADSLSNAIYEQKINKALVEIQRGVPISVILERESELFPPLATSVIGIGEKIGKLDETLIFVSKFYEQEVDNTTKNLSTIIEPVLMIFIGLTVGGLALAVITPIYQLTTAI